MFMVIVSTTAVVLAAWLIIRYSTTLSKGPKLDMPYVDFDNGKSSIQQYTHDTGVLLKQGYQMYLKKGLPFSMYNFMEASRPMVMLPVEYLGEVRNASASQLSFLSFMNKSTYAEDIGGPLLTDRVIRVARQDLNKSLNEMIEPIQQACNKTLSMLLPRNPEWTPHNGQSLIWPLIAAILARVFVGPDLCDRQEWHWVVLTYFQSGLAASQRVRDEYRPWLRWSAKYFDKDVAAVRAARQKGEQLLQPLIDARVTHNLERGNSRSPAFDDAVQWLVDAYMAEGKPVKAAEIMQDVAFLLAASLHGTNFTALSVLFDLIDRPESLAEIRAEIAKVYDGHGRWTRQSLGALRTLDSFMKESQRVNNFQYNTMQRRALVDYTFKDGLRIPVGTSIFMPSRLLGRDPDVHHDATSFDATRWKRMREQGDASKFHFASLQDDMLPWGSGPHACPGRFLVQEVLKVIFIQLLTKYDIKYAEGIDSRPPDLPHNTDFVPNLMAGLLFKER
ncbi:cytochrome P450 [Xylariales sp. PMI_506]|nr:cytochrome P450 [Xylariales sp. PMI_506]